MISLGNVFSLFWGDVFFYIFLIGYFSILRFKGNYVIVSSVIDFLKLFMRMFFGLFVVKKGCYF